MLLRIIMGMGVSSGDIIYLYMYWIYLKYWMVVLSIIVINYLLSDHLIFFNIFMCIFFSIGIIMVDIIYLCDHE